MAYQNDQVGKIIIVKNIVFEKSGLSKRQVDHAWRSGRPCVVLYTDDDYDYILPLTHELRHSEYSYLFYPLDDSKFIYQLSKDNRINYKISKEKKITNSFINLENIYKIPICGHTEVAKITLAAYKELVRGYIELHQITDVNNLSDVLQYILSR